MGMRVCRMARQWQSGSAWLEFGGPGSLGYRLALYGYSVSQ